jgi:hypothetical protein
LNGTLYGVACADLSLGQIGELLQNNKIGSSGTIFINVQLSDTLKEIFILETDGLLIASSQSRKPYLKDFFTDTCNS